MHLTNIPGKHCVGCISMIQKCWRNNSYTIQDGNGYTCHNASLTTRKCLSTQGESGWDARSPFMHIWLTCHGPCRFQSGLIRKFCSRARRFTGPGCIAAQPGIENPLHVDLSSSPSASIPSRIARTCARVFCDARQPKSEKLSNRKPMNQPPVR